VENKLRFAAFLGNGVVGVHHDLTKRIAISRDPVTEEKRICRVSECRERERDRECYKQRAKNKSFHSRSNFATHAVIILAAPIGRCGCAGARSGVAAALGYFTPRSQIEKMIPQIMSRAREGKLASIPNSPPVSHVGP
jgi:hypothetical protein